MAYYDALVTKWATLVSTTVAAKLAEINAIAVTRARAVNINLDAREDVKDILYTATTTTGSEWHDILGLADDTATGVAAHDAARISAKILRSAADNDEYFPTSEAAGLTSLTTDLTNLVTFGTISSASKTAILNNVSNETVPWWLANGYPGEITLNDVKAAGLS
jgi:hypothetical protein